MAKEKLPKRPRQSAQAGVFADPDDNFEPRHQHDPLEKTLAGDTVMVIKTAPFKAVAPDTPVEQVLQEMVWLDIACVLVMDGPKLVGILSERDVLNRIAGDFDRLRKKPVREVMTADPAFLYNNSTPAKALNLMAVGGFRHVPILDVDKRVVGVIGPRRVLNWLGQFFAA